MRTFAASEIRNVALVGHVGSGKTSLAEAVLAIAGATKRRGQVSAGTSVCDFEAEELGHGMSLSLAVASFESGGCRVNLLDTPGFADFGFEVANALSVAGLAVLVVSATEGVQAGTLAAWKAAAAAGVPRMVVLNKLDKENADFAGVLEGLKEAFGAGIAPLELPIMGAGRFVGVADLLADEAILYSPADAGQAPASSRAEIPEELAESEHKVREALVEGIVVGDDRLTERYLEGDLPSALELEAALSKGMREAAVFPVVCASAETMVGVDRLVDFLCELGPSPLQRPGRSVVVAGEERLVPADAAGGALVRVLHTRGDPYAGRISVLEVVSGTLRPDVPLVLERTHGEERPHGLFSLRGKEQEPLGEAGPGDIVAVTRLAKATTGDTLYTKGSPMKVVVPIPPKPQLTIALRPLTKGDEDKLMIGLHKLLEEDPCLELRRDDDTHQTLLSGAGETHLAVSLERLKRKFGVEVVTEAVAIAYLETIGQPAEAEGRYKKQTGGHGQFGVAVIRIEPLERGGGFEFVDQVVGGAIPRQYIPAVEKGIAEAMAQGGTWGYPVVDVRAICLDGKHHPVDSSEMSFKMAGALAFRECLAKVPTLLLEPISALRVVVPSSLQGDVLADLNARRGKVLDTDMDADGEQVISALVPAAELVRYAVDLRALSGGRASFEAVHDHYDVVPAHLAERIKPRVGA